MHILGVYRQIDVVFSSTCVEIILSVILFNELLLFIVYC